MTWSPHTYRCGTLLLYHLGRAPSADFPLVMAAEAIESRKRWAQEVMAVIDPIADSDPRLLIPVAERILMPILENAIVLVPEAEDRFRSWVGTLSVLHLSPRPSCTPGPPLLIEATCSTRLKSVASYLRELAIFHAAIPDDRPLGNQTWFAYALRDALECSALSIHHSHGGTAFLSDYVARESTAWPISPPTQYGRNLGGLGVRLLAQFEAVYRETVEELTGAMENVAGLQALWADAPYLLAIVRNPCLSLENATRLFLEYAETVTYVLHHFPAAPPEPNLYTSNLLVTFVRHRVLSELPPAIHDGDGVDSIDGDVGGVDPDAQMEGGPVDIGDVGGPSIEVERMAVGDLGAMVDYSGDSDSDIASSRE
ncbi:hypothetical protein FA95DRAFT_1609791 [Auriscalpium vulgare]|uniref:Uncharacterized protein n=1 Tax=Auriscalpium vulgare TaxID=40419 RepID=A0ACB8RH60_9AGAM|nr:hypothetical protein FA95DRAFT_1609791 [Auriscalpium vulgare]